MPRRKAWVDWVLHLHSSYPILWKTQKASLPPPAASQKGALWLEGGVETVEPPGWLPGQQDNTLFVKEVGCMDVQREKEDALWDVHGERWVRVKLNLA